MHLGKLNLTKITESFIENAVKRNWKRKHSKSLKIHKNNLEVNDAQVRIMITSIFFLIP